MGLLCTCPVAAELPDVTISTCPESLGQIQKLLFQRKFASAGTRNFVVVGTNNPNLQATWTPLLAASDNTKVIVSPYIQGPTVEAGGPRTFGGGNNTLGGIEVITGREPTTFEAMFHNMSQQAIKDLKAFMCEELQVYFIDEFGRIIGESDDIDSPVNFQGIPIANNSLFVGDKSLGGLEEPDMNMIRFQMLPNWSDNLSIVTPSDFEALTDLA